MPDKDLERTKKDDYYGHLYKELDIMNFLKKPITETRKTAQPTLEFPDIGKEKEDIGTEGIANIPELPTDIDTASPPPPPIDTTPTDTAPPVPEMEMVSEKGLSNKEKEQVEKSISNIKEHIDSIEDEIKASILKDQILQEVEKNYQDLQKELQSLKERKIPEREFYDTEGAYRDQLYTMATRVLDEFLPKLFEDIPEYNFIATQVSRTFEDGTVADALITLAASVVRDGMKYEFKIEVPVLNGLMQYPMYIQRGQKIIPLTYKEIQKELDSISYRKMDVETPYQEKENIFNNIGENIHRKPDTQKWYKIKPNTYKPVGLAPDHIYSPQRGKTIK